MPPTWAGLVGQESFNGGAKEAATLTPVCSHLRIRSCFQDFPLSRRHIDFVGRLLASISSGLLSRNPMMDPATYINPYLTRPDLLVLQNLLRDIDRTKNPASAPFLHCQSTSSVENEIESSSKRSSNIKDDSFVQDDDATIKLLNALNDPSHEDFEPTVFFTWDIKHIKLPVFVNDYFLQPYIRLAKKVVRVETDVVMLTHLLLYLTTSLPSAIFLYYRFHWLHGVLHWVMQTYYVGTYTLMMHQHIHMGGILARKYQLIDSLFPYITNPLMGHTWNSYYYHHVKHHHVEGNGPDDLSSTIYYQRDDLFNFLCYLGRFLFFIWLELPLYFLQNGKAILGIKAAFWEISSYLVIYFLARFHWNATLFAFILPFFLLRLALMVGNWGQHAFVDEADPNSDFRSSITLIDVASNRFCYNDGYHTSHHLHPRRHWREHPVAFLKQKQRYSTENALVFRNIDYMMMTIRLLRRDYMYLAKCLVPIGNQIDMTLDEIATMLQAKTRRFTKTEIQEKFGKKNGR
uniref:Fatty acid desaturase domain-containing protein n=1 Tax=Coccidioides posadasii RMSCC 3488 TaxID=454284 RepID=A0A0J6F3R1_COCPO|nr:hypothetical protein CPAG_03880 [Coccidioides posadasii RMSCC 3488]